MVLKSSCVPVIWTKVAPALERLRYLFLFSQSLGILMAVARKFRVFSSDLISRIVPEVLCSLIICVNNFMVVSRTKYELIIK